MFAVRAGQKKGWGYRDYFRQQAALGVVAVGQAGEEHETLSSELGHLLASARAQLAAWLTPALPRPHNGWGNRALCVSIGQQGAEGVRLRRLSSSGQVR